MILGINVHRFCEGLGVKVRPPRRARRLRPANVTHALGTIRNMLARDGEDHASLVIRCILESDPTALGADVITSVSLALKRHPDRFPSRQATVQWFGGVRLQMLRQRAQRLRTGPQTLSTLIADRMISE